MLDTNSENYSKENQLNQCRCRCETDKNNKHKGKMEEEKNENAVQFLKVGGAYLQSQFAVSEAQGRAFPGAL